MTTALLILIALLLVGILATLLAWWEDESGMNPEGLRNTLIAVFACSLVAFGLISWAISAFNLG